MTILPASASVTYEFCCHACESRGTFEMNVFGGCALPVGIPEGWTAIRNMIYCPNHTVSISLKTGDQRIDLWVGGPTP